MGCWVTTQQDYLDSIGKQSRPTTYTLEGAYVKGKGKRAKMALLMHAHTTFASYEYDDYYSVYTADGTDYSRSPLLKDAQDKMAARGFKYDANRTAELMPTSLSTDPVEVEMVKALEELERQVAAIAMPVIDSEATNGEMGVVVQGKTLAEWVVEGQANEMRDVANHVHPDYETSVYELNGAEREAYFASCTAGERELYAGLGVSLAGLAGAKEEVS